MILSSPISGMSRIQRNQPKSTNIILQKLLRDIFLKIDQTTRVLSNTQVSITSKHSYDPFSPLIGKYMIQPKGANIVPKQLEKGPITTQTPLTAQ